MPDPRLYQFAEPDTDCAFIPHRADPERAKRIAARIVADWENAIATSGRITWGRPRMPYTYTATIVKVHDGDTATAQIDLGFSLSLRMNIRVAGINARELHDPGGLEARDNLEALLPAGTTVTIATVKPDKYAGRVDAQVTMPDGADLALRLVTDGWAVRWDGRGTRPVPPWPRPTP